MSDGLVVSGGGRITVADADLLAALAACRAAADRIDEIAPRLAALGGGPAARRAQAAAARLRLLAAALLTAIDAYSAGEYAVELAVAQLIAAAAWMAGFLAPALLAGVPTAPAALVAARLAGEDPEGARAVLRALLADPRVVAAIRPAVDGADDALRGLLHLPPPLGVLFDDRGLGLLGREGTALLLGLGLAAAGVTTPGPAAVRRVSDPAVVRPPTSLADLAGRVPVTGGAAPQVRIERYAGGSGPRYVVYIGGTAQLRGSEPWDLASNLAAVAEVPADSAVATAEAMRRAGVRPGDPVVLVGYSQGGLIASELAAGAGFSVTGILTLGSPGGTADVPALSLEHTDDPVPALAGVAPPAPSTVRVERALFAGSAPDAVPGAPIVAGHSLDGYRETAALADVSGEERLTAMRQRLLAGFAGLSAGEMTRWLAERAAPAARQDPPVSGVRPPAAGGPGR